MPRKHDALLRDLSTADLKRLLAARERIDVLEKEKAVLLADLGKIERELDSLVASATAATGGGGGRKASPRKAARKKVVRRKSARKKPVGATTKKATKTAAGTAGRKGKKKVAKKAARKAVKKVAKKVAKKAAGKASRKGTGKAAPKAGGKGAAKKTLEDVIVQVLKAAGKPVPYRDLFAKIVDGKLFRTRSSNFDNVMRRTLSTSDRVQRVSRGVYGLA
ncbi:hypothetical protein KDM41_06395 [bacterium]|nr:hypothetical protein [bacterium]